MPERDEQRQRTRRRRDLLRALLEEEDAQDISGADLAAVMRELRRERQGERMGGLLSSDQMKGFLWGVGAGVLLLTVLPGVQDSLRPLAAAAAQGAMGLVEQMKDLFTGMQEGAPDIAPAAPPTNMDG